MNRMLFPADVSALSFLGFHTQVPPQFRSWLNRGGSGFHGVGFCEQGIEGSMCRIRHIPIMALQAGSGESECEG
jgi:hypothetical protein